MDKNRSYMFELSSFIKLLDRVQRFRERSIAIWRMEEVRLDLEFPLTNKFV